MDEIKKKALEKLMQRKAALQKAYDELIAEPESFGITGAVNATNRKLEDIRKEIAAIDEKINAVVKGGWAGMSVKWPDYRLSPFGGLQ